MFYRDNQTLSTDTAFLEDHIKSRRKRGIFSKKWNFDLEAPSINWQKHTGSQDIGASFGVVMINFLKLQIGECIFENSSERTFMA